MTRGVIYMYLVVVVCIFTPLLTSCKYDEDISAVLDRANSSIKENSEEAMRLIINYDYGDDDSKRANTFYEHALCQMENGNLPMAILTLDAALKSAKDIEDAHLTGLIYHTQGDIYYQCNLFNNSYDSYKEALSYFKSTADTIAINYTHYDIGKSAFRLHLPNETLNNLSIAISYAQSNSDSELTTLALKELCNLYLHREDWTLLSSTVEIFDELEYSENHASHINSMRAIIAAHNNDHDKAKYYFELAEDKNRGDNTTLEIARYYVYKCMGDEQKCIASLERIAKHLERMVLKATNQPMLNDQIALLEQHIAREDYAENLIRKRNIGHIIVLLIIIALLLHFITSSRRNMHRKEQNYMDTISELQLLYNRNDDKLRPLSSAIDKLYNDRLKDINQLCEIYYDHSDTPRQTTKVFEQVRQTIESIKSDEARLIELEELVDKCRDGLMRKLREECTKLNERELKVALYSYAGFSTRAICIFVDSNTIALSKIKYRIKAKIKEENCPSADLLISALN